MYLSMKIPGPLTLPIVGNAWMFINKTPTEIFQIIGKVIHDFGSVTHFWIGHELSIILSNPKHIEVILSNTKFIEKSDEYNYIRPWLNDGLILSNGEKWFHRRKITTPAFHFNILEKCIDIFEQQGDIFLDKLNAYDNNYPIELLPLISLYTLDVICESAMGVSVNAQTNPNTNYVKEATQVEHNLQLRAYHFLLRMDFFFEFSQLYKRNKKAIKILHSFTQKIIMERRTELEENYKKSMINTFNNNNNNDEFDFGIKSKKAFLDILLESTGKDGQPLSNSDIREEVDTFMIAGNATAAIGIIFCLFNIAKYPDVQRKCYIEIQEMLGVDKTMPAITLYDLNRLQYQNLVIRETLRLYPPAPIIGRKLRTPLKLDEHLIPADVNILIPIYTLGRDPNIFVNPTEFRPERFGEEINNDQFNPYGYIPFSAGPRNCIGQKFAMYEMKSIITKIIRNYEIRLAPDTESDPTLTFEVTLRPHNKLKFILTPRN